MNITCCYLFIIVKWGLKALACHYNFTVYKTFLPLNIFCHQIKMFTALCPSRHYVTTTDHINWHISPSIPPESHICSEFWMVKIFGCSVSFFPFIYSCHSNIHKHSNSFTVIKSWKPISSRPSRNRNRCLKYINNFVQIYHSQNHFCSFTFNVLSILNILVNL